MRCVSVCVHLRAYFVVCSSVACLVLGVGTPLRTPARRHKEVYIRPTPPFTVTLLVGGVEGNGAERPRLVHTQCWCPQGRWLLSPIVVYAANLFAVQFIMQGTERKYL